MKVLTKEEGPVRSVDGLKTGDTFKVDRFGSSKVFMFIGRHEMESVSKVTGEQIVVNAVSLDTGNLVLIDSGWVIYQINGTFVEEGCRI